MSRLFLNSPAPTSALVTPHPPKFSTTYHTSKLVRLPQWKWKTTCFRNSGVDAFFSDPILQQALKEPVAFAGGVFAGLLRLDLNEDPLKEWVTRTVEASGISEEEIDDEGSKPEEVPQQIEIE
ncbi:hypothetical protein AAG906_007641 [Vitis piasezkii]